MEYPRGPPSALTERSAPPELGSPRVRCPTGAGGFNQRTGTLCNRLHAPTEGIGWGVLWRLRSHLS